MENTIHIPQDTVNWKTMRSMLNNGKLMPILSTKAVLNMVFQDDNLYDKLIKEYAASICSYITPDIPGTDETPMSTVRSYEENLLARCAQYYMVRQKWEEVGTKQEFLDHVKRSLWRKVQEDVDKLRHYNPGQANKLLPQDVAHKIGQQLNERSSATDFVMETCRYRAFLGESGTHPLCTLLKQNVGIYLTTCPFRFLEAGLVVARPKTKPQTMAYPWRENPSRDAALRQQTACIGPESDKPIIYHLCGLDDDAASLVLTEDDHLEFVEHLQTNFNHQDVVPGFIHLAITEDYYPVLIGYDLNSWELRDLWRVMRKRSSGTVQKMTRGCAIQIDPCEAFVRFGEANGDDLRKYVENYFDSARLDIAWTKPSKFIERLCTQLEG